MVSLYTVSAASEVFAVVLDSGAALFVGLSVESDFEQPTMRETIISAARISARIFFISCLLCVFYILGAEAPKISISGFHLGIALQSGKRSPKITYFAQRSSSQKMTLFTFSFRPSTLSVVAQMDKQSFVQTAAGSSM